MSVNEMDSSILYTDGGFNRHTTPDAWGSVVYFRNGRIVDALHEFGASLKSDMQIAPRKLARDTRDVVICHYPGVKHQNNGAELNAFFLGLQIAHLHPDRFSMVMCDSDLVLKYWSRGHMSETARLTMPDAKRELIEQCGRLRAAVEEQGVKIQFIQGDQNPSDLGFHVSKHR